MKFFFSCIYVFSASVLFNTIVTEMETFPSLFEDCLLPIRATTFCYSRKFIDLTNGIGKVANGLLLIAQGESNEVNRTCL